MRYFKKLKKRNSKVEVIIPAPIPFFKKPNLPKLVLFDVHKIEFVRESKLFLS